MCNYCSNAKCKDTKVQRYRNAKCEMQKCKMLGHMLAQLLMEPFIFLYDQYLLLLMSRIAVLCCYVHSEREKQSTPHWSSSCSSWYSYSKYSWSITCYPGHYCLRSCSSPSCWRLCLSGSGRSPCGVIAIIIIITRPKPASGRQGLVGSWGQDTDEVSTFLVFLTSHFAPVALSSDLNQPWTIDDNKNPLEIMKTDLDP